MAIISTKEMFKKAYANHYAVGAFNINNMEIIQAVTEAAAEEKSPVILQVSAGARKYAKPAYLLALDVYKRQVYAHREPCANNTPPTRPSLSKFLSSLVVAMCSLENS